MTRAPAYWAALGHECRTVKRSDLLPKSIAWPCWCVSRVAMLMACDLGPAPVASPPPAGPFVSGTPVFEANGWIEYVPGDAPLIVIAPHGGRLTPFRLRKRKCEACLGGIDSHTAELARLVADSFATRTVIVTSVAHACIGASSTRIEICSKRTGVTTARADLALAALVHHTAKDDAIGKRVADWYDLKAMRTRWTAVESDNCWRRTRFDPERRRNHCRSAGIGVT